MKHSIWRSKLDLRQLGICRRVEVARSMLGFTQAEFAVEAGITRSLLANIETGKSPLRAGLGLHLCKVFNLNERWLADGEGAFQPIWFWSYKIVGLEYRELFSAIYDVRLRDKARRCAKKRRNPAGSGSITNPSQAEVYLNYLAQRWIQACPKNCLGELVKSIDSSAQEILKAVNPQS